MASKISELTADASPTTDDLLVSVNDPSGTPANRKVTIANLDTLLSQTTKTLTNKTLTAPVINNATGLWQPRYIIKAANETVNNSTTLQDDADFVFAIGANEKWMVELWLVITSVSANSDFKMGFTAPASCTSYWARNATSSFAGGGGWSGTPVANTPIAIRTISDSSQVGSGNLTYGTHITGFFYNSTNSGNIQFQWAQDTLTAEDTIVLANSVMRYTRIA